MKGSRVKPLGIGHEIEVGLMGTIHGSILFTRDGFPEVALIRDAAARLS